MVTPEGVNWRTVEFLRHKEFIFCVVYIRIVYYESIKRELKINPIYECRCDERLKPKVEESTRLGYTGVCLL